MEFGFGTPTGPLSHIIFRCYRGFVALGVVALAKARLLYDPVKALTGFSWDVHHFFGQTHQFSLLTGYNGIYIYIMFIWFLMVRWSLIFQLPVWNP